MIKSAVSVEGATDWVAIMRAVDRRCAARGTDHIYIPPWGETWIEAQHTDGYTGMTIRNNTRLPVRITTTKEP